VKPRTLRVPTFALLAAVFFTPSAVLAAPRLLGVGRLPGSATDMSGLTDTLEDGTPHNRYEFSPQGKRLRALTVPEKFLVGKPSAVANDELPPGNTAGRQSNRGMEGLAISPDGTKLYGIMQSPLLQDGGLDAANARKGLNVRILEVDTASAATREFLYPLEAAGNGISEIVAVNAQEFLVRERDGRAGAQAAFKRLYRISLAGPTAGTSC